MHRFIERMALRNAVNAALLLRQNHIYTENVAPDQRRAFREDLKTWLKKLALRYYVWDYDGNRYCAEILALRNYLRQNHGQILAMMTIGICQKAISLWLKYMWLMGDCSKMPKFAPLDRGIVHMAHVLNQPNWSEIDDIEEYRRIVEHIDNFARERGYGCGAVWEAETWTDELDDEAA